MALVLCTGIDQALIETRKLILEFAGHTVITASSEGELKSACGRHDFAVAVVGQMISPNVKREVASLIRRCCPAARILELYPLHEGKSLENADAWMEVPVDVPDELVKKVKELAGDNAGRRAAG